MRFPGSEKEHDSFAKRGICFLISIVIASFLVPASVAQPWYSDQPTETSGRSGACSFVPGEVLVGFRGGSDAGARSKALADAGGETVMRKMGPRGEKNTWLVRLEPSVSVRSAIDNLESESVVAFAEPNYTRGPLYTPGDPDFPRQWGLSNSGQEVQGVEGIPGADIGAKSAWDIERGFTNETVVALLDSGIEFAHPDLAAKIWRNPGEIPDNGIDDDDNGYVDDVNGYNFVGISQTCCYYVSGGQIILTSIDMGAGPGTRVFAQSIEGTGQDLTHAGMLIGKAGSPTKSIRVSVRSSLDGQDLSSFEVNPGDVGGLYTEVYKPLSSTLTLETGKTYYLVAGTYNDGSDGYYKLFHSLGEKSPEAYMYGGEFHHDGSKWIAFGDDDLYFKTNPNPYPADDDGHGTMTAGIAGAAENGVGVVGVCPGARIMPLKVLDASGVPSGALNTAQIVEAIYYAADNGAGVISMSIGSYWYSDSEQEAIDYAWNRGVVMVAAAGNDADDTMVYPAGCNHVMGAGATDNRDRVASFSNHNLSVDVSAPGKSVYSTRINSGYGYGGGTSSATPTVAGLAALILSNKPGLSPVEVVTLIEETSKDLGEPGRDDYYGYGRIDAAAALAGLSSSFYFAEGTCRPGFDPYICVQNPGDEDAAVKITYMKGDGTNTEQEFTVGPSSRYTVKVKDLLGEADDISADFSCKVESTNGRPITAERPMYFDYAGVDGGHDVVGF